MAAESDEDLKSLRRYRLSDPDSGDVSLCVPTRKRYDKSGLWELWEMAEIVSTMLFLTRKLADLETEFKNKPPLEVVDTAALREGLSTISVNIGVDFDIIFPSGLTRSLGAHD